MHLYSAQVNFLIRALKHFGYQKSVAIKGRLDNTIACLLCLPSSKWCGSIDLACHFQALAELEGTGIAKVLYNKESGEVLGVHIIGIHASDLIQVSISFKIALCLLLAYLPLFRPRVLFFGRMC
jgi:hypothetical protein